MNLDEYLQLGRRIELGTHRFEPDEIKAFARKFDPQPFHVDEEAAARSVFGKLCASGWHTASMWMKYNLAFREDIVGSGWTGAGPAPEFGPSPGFRNLRWLKPVFAGDRISFTREVTGHRPRSAHPGWHVVVMRCGAYHADTGEAVLDFESSVLLKTA